MIGPRAALGLLIVARAALAEPCAPRADLAGDAEAVASVAAELERLGVEANTSGSASTTRCPVIVAAVELDRSGGIAVAVRDTAHRSEGRVVSDAALAAAWIDSWLRDDFTAPELPTAEVHEVAPSSAAPTLGALDKFSVTGAFTQTWTFDETHWSGAALASCVGLGELCVGARLAYAWQDISFNATAAARRDLSVLATASYPTTVGRMSIAPEVGLGIGRLAIRRIDGCKMETMCDPNDPTCAMTPPPCGTNPGIYVGDDLRDATYTPRGQAALRIAVPLFDHVWLDGVAAATLAPFGHSAPYSSANLADDPLALPGDPSVAVQLGIGLRLGAP